MGIISTIIDYTLAGVVIVGTVVGGVIGVVLVSLFGIFIKVLPFLIKLGAVALLAYFGLSIFGIV